MRWARTVCWCERWTVVDETSSCARRRATHRPLHVAVVCQTFPKLSETFVVDHVTALLRRGHEVSIVASPPSEPEPLHDGDELLRRVVLRQEAPATRAGRAWALLVRGLGRGPSGARRVAAAVRHGRGRAGPLHVLGELDALERLPQVDLVHAHFGHVGAAVAGALLTGGRATPLVTTFHGSDVGRFGHQGMQSRYVDLFARADRLLTVSELWRERLREFGAPVERMTVLRQGVDVDVLPFRQRARVPGPYQVLSVGRLTPKKGFVSGLAAVAALVDRGLDVQYRVVGEGQQRDELEKLIAELGLVGRVHLLGARPRDGVRRLLYESDVLLAPSRTAPNGDQEGIPVVLMEAMASGLPVVSTRHSGIPELVEHEVTGLLADEGDAVGLADQLERLHREQDLARVLATAGRRRVESEYNAARQVDRLETLYSELVS